MPKLSQLTDYQSTPSGRIYVSPSIPTSDYGDLYNPTYPDELPVVAQQPSNSNGTKSVAEKIADKLLGLHGEERYQLWPEKVVRSALTAIPDAYSGKIPMYDTDPETGELVPSQAMIGRAMDMATFAGVGGIGGTGEGAGTVLGATPSLRPALKYNGRLYKGREGQQHMDVIPDHLYNDFQQKAMSGEDISHYNFGFVNDKGHFLDREAALKYGIDTGLIDPQAGKFGALTSTLMADSSKPGTAIEATAKTAQPFYSAVEHQVNAIPQAKMTGEQWLGTLANKPGVKPEELDWTGLRDFLTENKGQTLTKQQVQDYVAANKVELKEVNKGAEKLNSVAKEFDAAVGNGVEWGKGKLYSDEIKRALLNEDLTPADLPTHLQGLAKNLIEANKENIPTKYHSYQLPGGENYREMLLTMPEKPTASKWSYKSNGDRFDVLDENGIVRAWAPSEAAAKDRIATLEPRNDKSKYRSSHWDEPNILAHVRMNDRTIEGKKSLHLEEIQSDWHQQGRDKGYASPENKAKYDKLIEDKHNAANEVNKLEANFKKEVAKGYDIHNLTFEEKQLLGKKLDEVKANSKEYQEAYLKYKALSDEISNGNPHLGVPDAPFKKTWHELALKRMLREAAEKGYDRLSWTPGEAQAARYDLSKQVDKVNLVPDPSGKLRIDAFKNNQKVLEHFAKDENEVASVVGKEVAEKLLKNRNQFGASTVAGTDLKIGGEGMKGFYDQIIPKALEKIGKEHGVKVKELKATAPKYAVYQRVNKVSKEFDTAAEARAWGKENGLEGKSTVREVEGTGNPHNMFYIDIPQSLKDKAMQKGFPLFSTAMPGYMFKPVDGNPFDQEQK